MAGAASNWSFHAAAGFFQSPDTPSQPGHGILVAVRHRCRCCGFAQDAAEYEGSAPLNHAIEFLSLVARSDLLPATCALDIGYVQNRGWMVIEANAAWGAGLNGCDPDKVLGSIAHATRAA